LGKQYIAEHHFTRALALCVLREFDAASSEAHKGLEAARRPSSERNGWFLLGCIALRRGEHETGLQHFERGLGLPYRGPGGWALLQRARSLRELERSEARAGFELVVARDPESVFASEARRELARME